MSKEIKTKEDVLAKHIDLTLNNKPEKAKFWVGLAMDEWAEIKSRERAIGLLKYWNYECVGYDIEEGDEEKFNETYNLFIQQTEKSHE
jgi:hypothetical protein